MEKGRGAVAIALVETGTLKNGSVVVVGQTYGKIRNLELPRLTITEAGPSTTPVILTGFRELPEFGQKSLWPWQMTKAKENRRIKLGNQKILPNEYHKQVVSWLQQLIESNRTII